MKHIFSLLSLLLLCGCWVPETSGFYNPITLSVSTPEGPPEYKAGWYSGCKSALGNKSFSNAWVYRVPGKGPEFGNGVHQHDPAFQTGFGQGWFACYTHVGDFVGEGDRFRSMGNMPLQ